MSYSLPYGGVLVDGFRYVGYQDRVITDSNLIKEILGKYLENKDTNIKTLR